MIRLLAVVLMTAAVLCAAEHGGGGEAPSQTWKWVNFLVLAGLIAYGVAKNAGPLLKARSYEIRKGIEEAKLVKAEAEQRAAAIEKQIANLAGELDRLRTEARHEMENEAARIREETQKAIARMEENALNEIDSYSKQVSTELKRHAAKLALKLAEEKVKSRVTPLGQTALVQRFVADLRKPLN